MPSINRRTILNNLETNELRSLHGHLDMGEGAEIERNELLDELAQSSAPLGEMLMTLSRQRLKELCRKQGINDSGREKIMIATRLLGIDPSAPPKPKAVPPIRRVRRKQ